MRARHRVRLLGVTLLVEIAALATLAGAQDSTARVTPPPAAAIQTGHAPVNGGNDAVGTNPTDDDGVLAGPVTRQALQAAITEGSFSLDLRLRAEFADQSGLRASQAYTQRLRLGYATKPIQGVSLFAELEDIRSADDRLYNAAGLNGEPDRTVIADPEDTELNQFLARYESDVLGVVLGRQRLLLDDTRFVGNVGWRQNEQTFDALTVTSRALHGVRVLYSYVDEVNRIFGPDARRDFASDSHLLHISSEKQDWGSLSLFAYLFDFSNAPASSSNTVGVRYTGEFPCADAWTGACAASYAYQVDAAGNPTSYRTHYFAVEATVRHRRGLRFGAGYEVLGSQGGNASFQTPLATLHAFNGWADVFLNTPPDGLEDLYILVSSALPGDLTATAVAHLFFSEDRSSDLGRELDAMLSWKASQHVTVTGKLAWFDGATDRFPDTLQRAWLQVEVRF